MSIFFPIRDPFLGDKTRYERRTSVIEFFRVSIEQQRWRKQEFIYKNHIFIKINKHWFSRRKHDQNKPVINMKKQTNIFFRKACITKGYHQRKTKIATSLVVPSTRRFRFCPITVYMLVRGSPRPGTESVPRWFECAPWSTSRTRCRTILDKTGESRGRSGSRRTKYSDNCSVNITDLRVYRTISVSTLWVPKLVEKSPQRRRYHSDDDRGGKGSRTNFTRGQGYSDCLLSEHVKLYSISTRDKLLQLANRRICSKPRQLRVQVRPGDGAIAADDATHLMRTAAIKMYRKKSKNRR